jgi:hypothetical protein
VAGVVEAAWGIVEAAWGTHGEMTDEAVTNARRYLVVSWKIKYCIIYIASKVVPLRGSRMQP